MKVLTTILILKESKKLTKNNKLPCSTFAWLAREAIKNVIPNGKNIPYMRIHDLYEDCFRKNQRNDFIFLGPIAMPELSVKISNILSKAPYACFKGIKIRRNGNNRKKN